MNLIIEIEKNTSFLCYWNTLLWFLCRLTLQRQMRFMSIKPFLRQKQQNTRMTLSIMLMWTLLNFRPGQRASSGKVRSKAWSLRLVWILRSIEKHQAMEEMQSRKKHLQMPIWEERKMLRDLHEELMRKWSLSFRGIDSRSPGVWTFPPALVLILVCKFFSCLTSKNSMTEKNDISVCWGWIFNYMHMTNLCLILKKPLWSV